MDIRSRIAAVILRLRAIWAVPEYKALALDKDQYSPNWNGEGYQ